MTSVFVAPSAVDDGLDFRHWSFVSVPYCDGSVYAGDNDLPDATPEPRYHRGRRNLAAALDLAVQHFPNPRRVLLAGSSGGGYGTITAMLAVRMRYPNANLFVLDDAGPGVFNLAESEDMEERLSEWKYGEVIPASCAACNGGREHLARLFSWMLEHDRQVRVGVLSAYQDQVISLFLRVSGEGYEALMRPVMDGIFAAHGDRFRRFMRPGATHPMGAPDAEAGGVRLGDWATAMTDADDAGWQDIQATDQYACQHEDRASCEAETGCAVVLGTEDTSEEPSFQGCAPARTHCTSRTACAVAPLQRACAQFQTSCLPNAWNEVPCDTPGCPGRPALAVVPDCEIRTIASYLTGSTAASCGVLERDRTPEATDAARACVLAAQSKKSAFVVDWDTRGPVYFGEKPSAMIRKGFVGSPNGAGIDVYGITHATPLGDSAPTSEWSRCQTFGDAACDADTTPLCLACVPDPAAHCTCGPGYSLLQLVLTCD